MYQILDCVINFPLRAYLVVASQSHGSIKYLFPAISMQLISFNVEIECEIYFLPMSRCVQTSRRDFSRVF